MKKTFQHTSGFSAVELLITLFVAAVFLAAGYQLFNVILKDGGATRAESTVGNVAYDYVRRYSTSATNPCTILTPLSNEPVTIDSIANPKVTVAITCPQADAPSLSKVEVSITYGAGSDVKTIKSATYVDRSTGASPTSDVTDGLIAWWKLNQDASSSVGTHHGSMHNVSPAVGQNGFGANAFSFNGSNSWVQLSLDAVPKPTAAFSVTAWFYASSTSSYGILASTAEAGGWSLGVFRSGCTMGATFIVYVNGADRVICSGSNSIVADAWNFVAGIYNGASVRIYINGGAVTSTSVSGAMTWPTDTAVPLCIGANPNAQGCTSDYFNGLIDDVRYYGRALTGSEATQLYNGGAK